MKYRTLGRGLKVSAIGIGCMPMISGGNIASGHADRLESIRAIHEAIDLGITVSTPPRCMDRSQTRNWSEKRFVAGAHRTRSDTVPQTWSDGRSRARLNMVADRL